MSVIELEKKVASDFPAVATELDGNPVIYLDSAATTLKPKQMVDAINEYYLGISCNVHRGKNYSLEVVSNRYEEARYKVAELISCSGNEVVFLRNTTEAINLVANGLGLTKDDTVLVFGDSHHANLLPWMENATIQTVTTDDNGKIDLEHYYQLLEQKPKVVAITHCSNVTGVYCPLETMATAAKKSGAIVVVDAAQSIPHRRMKVNQLDVDFVTFSAHKMLGPTGVGVLFGKKEQLEQLKPLNLGGGMVDWVESDSYRLRKIPHRFEAGTPHIAGAYGVAAAIDYLNNIGFDHIEQHDRKMGQLMLSKALERDYLKVVNDDPEADRGAVISFYIPQLESLDEIARILSDSYGIMCRNGHLCAQPYVTKVANSQVLRASAYIYNSEDDIEKFFSALDEIIQFMLN